MGSEWVPSACLVLRRGDSSVRLGGLLPPLKREELSRSQEVRTVGSLPFVPFGTGGSLPPVRDNIVLDPLRPICRSHHHLKGDGMGVVGRHRGT